MEKENVQTVTAFEIPTPEPWHTPVDGAELLNDLVAAYKKYVILPEHAAPTLALWTLYTYGFQGFDFSPRLTITSPEKRCGKSTLLIMLEILASKTLSTSNISTASIYRIIELVQPTLLLDEADTFLAKNPDMAGVLNAGHRFGGKAIRTEYRGRTAVPTLFNCFSPCAIAAIKKKAIPGPLLDRSIIIQMRRKTAMESVEKLRIKDAENEFADLTRKCARFMNDNIEQIGFLKPDVPNVLSSRGADNWEPLIAIADHVSPQWGHMARNSAIALTRANEQDDDDGSVGLQLLWDMREIFQSNSRDCIPSTEICGKLTEHTERGWNDYGYRHEPIRPHHIARLLKDFGIRSKDKRMGSQVVKCYFREDFTEAFERYLPLEVRDTATMAETESDSVATPKIKI